MIRTPAAVLLLVFSVSIARADELPDYEAASKQADTYVKDPVIAQWVTKDLAPVMERLIEAVFSSCLEGLEGTEGGTARLVADVSASPVRIRNDAGSGSDVRE